MSQILKDSPRIYVGTYNAYNRGSLKGAWINLDDCADEDAFFEAAVELHRDVVDPELMFQDWENIPDQFISESSLRPAFWDYLRAKQNTHLSEEAFDAGVNAGLPFDEVEERYVGEFSNNHEIGIHLAENECLFDGLPEFVERYFDFDAYGRDAAMGWTESDGHYFVNY